MNRIARCASFSLAVFSGGVGPLFAAPTIPKFDLPVDCVIGSNCWIQNYFDHQAGPSYQDYACGFLTYDGHKGTDFRVSDEETMRSGVPVVAAASGVVLGVRDGEPDIPVSIRGETNVSAKEAGNGVLVDHGNGWQTQYSHLLKGSVSVAKGQRVEQGQRLGLVGESGNAEFPHVDFSVRYKGVPVDPFQPTEYALCSPEMASDALWGDKARLLLSYIPTAILQVGVTDHIPNRLEAQGGKLSSQQLSTRSPGLVFWTQIMGMRDGDRVYLKINQPDGRLFVETVQTIQGNKAVWVGGVGQRRSTSTWMRGEYSGSISVLRQNKVIAESRTTLFLR